MKLFDTTLTTVDVESQVGRFATNIETNTMLVGVVLVVQSMPRD